MLRASLRVRNEWKPLPDCSVDFLSGTHSKARLSRGLCSPGGVWRIFEAAGNVMWHVHFTPDRKIVFERTANATSSHGAAPVESWEASVVAVGGDPFGARLDRQRRKPRILR